MPWVGRALRQPLQQAIPVIYRKSFILQSTRTLSLSTPKPCLAASQTHPHRCRSIAGNKVASSSTSNSSPTNLRKEENEGLQLYILNLVEAGYSFGRILKDSRTSATLSQYLLNRDNVRTLAEAIARTRIPRHAHRVLRMAYQLGCPLKQNVYECVTYQLAEAGHWHLIPSLVSLGINHTGRTTVRLLNWQTRAYIETSHYASLEGVLEEFKKQKLKPNRRTFHLLISGHIRNQNLGNAKRILQQMEEAGFPLDSSTHALVVSVYRSLGPDPHLQARAFEALRDLGGPAATMMLNSLLQLRLDAGNLPGALEILLLFNQHNDIVGLLPESGENTTGGGGDLPSSSDHPKQNRVPFDVITFSMLINYMLDRKDPPRALRIYQKMIASGIQPDAGVIASLVRIYFAMDKGDAAVHIVAKMCQSHEEATHLFNSLMSARAERSESPPVPIGIPPSIEVFNALIANILRGRGLNRAVTILRIMRACNIRPNSQTIGIFIAYLGKQEWSCPRTLVNALRVLSATSVPPTLRQVHAILSSVMRHEKRLLRISGWDVHAAKFSPQRHDESRIPEDHILNNSETFDPTAGIELSQPLSDHSLMRPAVQSLSVRSVRSDRATIALRIRHDAVHKSDLEAAKGVFHSMLARGMHPNEYHFSALMEGFAHKGEPKAAEDVLSAAMRAGITPNVVMFTILIVGYARQGDPDSAMRVFQDMMAAGVKPDVPAIDAVASAYFIVGAYAKARQVLIQLWSHVQPFPPELDSASLKQLARTFRSLQEDGGVVRKRLTNEKSLWRRPDLKRLVNIWKVMGTTRAKKRFRVSARPSSSHVAPRVTKS